MEPFLNQVGLSLDDELDNELDQKSQYKQRMQDMRFHSQACEDAIAGRKLPEYLGSRVIQLCVIRGIRYHAGFGRELNGLTPAFTRALNAQDIMNNRIPDMSTPEEIPYCIWHPSVPTRQTCRELASRYPQMKYQVGRACAVAGYFDVYCELSLLPEVHIAEEARERGSLSVYDMIMSQPVKYAVFNDYIRTINHVNPPIAALNGDTLVVSHLDLKQQFRRPTKATNSLSAHPGFDEREMDITEDMCIDTYISDRPKTDQSVVVPLLYSPLPNDLPTVQKDLLILVAAYNGDIDRYARLRRPHMVRGERNCLVRGIYHSPIFAKWCSLQPVEKMDNLRIKMAINARFIMSNDLSRISAQTDPLELPYNIWFPQPASGIIYEELVRRRPAMKLQAARACIVADYQDVYKKIDPQHDEALVREAKASQNPYYLNDLLQKKEAGNSTGETYRYYEAWKVYTDKNTLKVCTTTVLSHLEPGNVGTSQEWIYDGIEADLRAIEVSICAPPDIKESGIRHYDEIYLTAG